MRTMSRSKVIYFPVHNLEYPRNARIRNFLEHAGYEVTAIDRGHGAFERSTWMNRLGSTIRFIREGVRSDVIVLSELSNQYALMAWAVSRLGGSVLVVDGFVGLYETQVEDWRKYHPSSWRAKVLRYLDSRAARLSDIYLIDTDVRAQAIRKMYSGMRGDVFALPVGAPSWSSEIRSTVVTEPGIRMLHYGNFAPLNGVSTIVEAFSTFARTNDDAHLTLVGVGQNRPYIEDLLAQHDVVDRSTVLDRVAESEIAGLISQSDVLLGIFGGSDKASTVIPNKVWQGLSAGRTVITRESPALAEIRDVVGSRLIEVPAGDSSALAEAMATLGQADDRAPEFREAEELDLYVEERFQEFSRALSVQVSHRPGRRRLPANSDGSGA